MLISMVFIFLFFAFVAWIAFKNIGITVKLKANDDLQHNSLSNRVLRFITIIAIVLQVVFWVLYLSTILTKFQEWVADVYWIGTSVAGIIIGMLGAIKADRKIVLSYISFIGGILLLALYLLARFITSM